MVWSLDAGQSRRKGSLSIDVVGDWVVVIVNASVDDVCCILEQL